MELRLYNTLTKSVDPVRLLRDDGIRMYSCGPTVYNVAHIGNIRAFLCADLIQRTLRTVGGHAVTWVMNITDIDDKTIRDSAPGSERWREAMGPNTDDHRANLRRLTSFYTDEFLHDIRAVGIDPGHMKAMPRATDFVPQMQDLIRGILQAGHAYVADGSVYFDVNAYRKSHAYGRLFHIDVEHFREGARIDADEYDRESVSDFVLWKGVKPGEPFWDFDLDGVAVPGRPGWHIECSAMSSELLGLPFDIHTGGVDLRFPHHEDELAQSCSGYHVAEQATMWCHNEFLEVDGKKMSKSLGNFYTLRDLLDRGIDPLDVRYAFLASHYRNVVNFTFDGVAAASAARAKVQGYIHDVVDVAGTADVSAVPHAGSESIFASLADDCHTPRALAALFSFIADHPVATLDAATAASVLAALRRVNDVFNVWTIGPRPAVVVPDTVRALAEERWAARAARDWAEADRLRDVLAGHGWVMKDGKTSYELSPL